MRRLTFSCGRKETHVDRALREELVIEFVSCDFIYLLDIYSLSFCELFTWRGMVGNLCAIRRSGNAVIPLKAVEPIVVATGCRLFQGVQAASIRGRARRGRGK